MIKTIIFDLGGVVVSSFGKELVANASKKLGIKPDELRKLMNVYEPDLQTGKINHIEFLQKILKDKNLSIPVSILNTLWMNPYKKYAKINKNIIKLIKKLKKNYIIGCISNTHEAHNSYNRKRRLFDYFDIYLLSNQVGIRKPDKKIFELYLKKANYKPSEAIFIDDEEKLLINAKKLGIKTIHFKNIRQLKKELTQEDILI